MSRQCGECTACCSLMHVPELDKQMYVLCNHCILKRGCNIYNDRPTSCRTFECLWYKYNELPDELRPDECGVMVEELPKVNTVLMHSIRTGAWKLPPVTELIIQLLEDGRPIVIIDGKEKHMMLPQGVEREEVNKELEVAYGEIYGSTNL